MEVAFRGEPFSQMLRWFQKKLVPCVVVVLVPQVDFKLCCGLKLLLLNVVFGFARLLEFMFVDVAFI